MKALISLKRDDSIMILPADKGNKAVVIDTATYIEAGEQIVSDTNVYECLNKNLVMNEQWYLNKRIKEIFGNMLELGTKSIPPYILSRCPKLPHMYFLPKIHKDPLAWRPIVSQAGTFSAPLAKHLAKILSLLLG